MNISAQCLARCTLLHMHFQFQSNCMCMMLPKYIGHSCVFMKVDLAPEIQLASYIMTKHLCPGIRVRLSISLISCIINYHNDITLVVGYTVDMERFAGLNACGFNPTEVLAEILSCCLSQKYILLKKGTYIHGKTFAVLLKTTKTMKVSSANLSSFTVAVTETAWLMLWECSQVLICISTYVI